VANIPRNLPQFSDVLPVTSGNHSSLITDTENISKWYSWCPGWGLSVYLPQRLALLNEGWCGIQHSDGPSPRNTAVSRVRHYATSWKIMDLSLMRSLQFFNWSNPLTKSTTRNLQGGGVKHGSRWVRLTISPHHQLPDDNLENVGASMSHSLIGLYDFIPFLPVSFTGSK
jgi:hypothetical protein